MERVVSVYRTEADTLECVTFETDVPAYYSANGGDDREYGQVTLSFVSLREARNLIQELIEEVETMEAKEAKAEREVAEIEGEGEGERNDNV